MVSAEPIDLARAALVIAKLEYPVLDPRPSLIRLRELSASISRSFCAKRSSMTAKRRS